MDRDFRLIFSTISFIERGNYKQNQINYFFGGGWGIFHRFWEDFGEN
jgi:hypothetical protein